MVARWGLPRVGDGRIGRRRIVGGRFDERGVVGVLCSDGIGSFGRHLGGSGTRAGSHDADNGQSEQPPAVHALDSTSRCSPSAAWAGSSRGSYVSWTPTIRPAGSIWAKLLPWRRLDGSGNEHGGVILMALLEVEEISVQFGGIVALDGLSFQIEDRPDLRPDRSERCGQDDDVQRGQPHLRSAREAAFVSTATTCSDAGPPDLQGRRVPHLPEPGAVAANDA